MLLDNQTADSLEYKSFFENSKAVLADEKSKSIYKFLAQFWFCKEYDKIDFFTDLESNQYFTEELISLTEQESFVDCGAYTGDTFKKFLQNTPSGNFQKAYLFEMDKNTFGILKENIDDMFGDKLNQKLKLYEIGVGEIKETKNKFQIIRRR